jgi:hypothetical protein
VKNVQVTHVYLEVTKTLKVNKQKVDIILKQWNTVNQLAVFVVDANVTLQKELFLRFSMVNSVHKPRTQR